eukprot:g16443.t1
MYCVLNVAHTSDRELVLSRDVERKPAHIKNQFDTEQTQHILNGQALPLELVSATSPRAILYCRRRSGYILFLRCRLH